MYFNIIDIMKKTVVSTNRKAYHEFHILENFEAGIQLKGSEVKSIREGSVSLKQSYIVTRKGEAWIKALHIPSYSHTGYDGHEPLRNRKLLLHKREILKIDAKLAEKGLTAVPTKLYFKGGLVKIELGLAKGKKLYDKRQDQKNKDWKRQKERLSKIN